MLKYLSYIRALFQQVRLGQAYWISWYREAQEINNTQSQEQFHQAYMPIHHIHEYEPINVHRKRHICTSYTFSSCACGVPNDKTSWRGGATMCENRNPNTKQLEQLHVQIKVCKISDMSYFHEGGFSFLYKTNTCVTSLHAEVERNQIMTPDYATQWIQHLERVAPCWIENDRGLFGMPSVACKTHCSSQSG